MVAVPFPLSTAPGRNAQESAGRLINCEAEALGAEGRNKAVWRRTPGLKLMGTTAETGWRGGIGLAGLLYGAWSGKVYKFASTGGAGTLIGTLSGTAPVFWARNNKSPTADLVVVDPGNGASVVTSSAVSAYPDADVGQPNSVCFLDGYFFFTYGNGICRSSGLNSTDINTLDFITAESNPDGLLRGISYNGMLLLFGLNSCEFWSGHPPNDTGFPFNRLTSTPYGLIGANAIAGHEDGFGKALIWVGTDGKVHMLKDGSVPTEISPPDLDRLIEAVADKNDLRAGVFIAGGVPRWVLSGPTWTWSFNLNTLKWSELASYLTDKWRGSQPCFVFNKWLCGDLLTGNVLQIDAATRNEAGDPLIAILESASISKFPNRTRIARIDVDVTVGVGIATGTQPDQTDPVLELSFSRDCVNYDPPRLLPLGAQAHADQRVFDTRFGLSGPQGGKIRIAIADDVDFGIMGADISAELRVK